VRSVERESIAAPSLSRCDPRCYRLVNARLDASVGHPFRPLRESGSRSAPFDLIDVGEERRISSECSQCLEQQCVVALVAEHGGDPNRIFVAGISTGALHAATYVFRPELLPPDAARAAGAILVSGPYTFDFDTAGRGELAYFGEDRARWPEMVVNGNVTRTVQTLPVVRVDKERGLLLVKGSVPGADGGHIIVRAAAKTPAAKGA